jgi:outer membrane protein assembly factor BamB
MSYGAGGGSPPTIMLGSVYYNMPGGVFRRQDIRTGEILWEKPGSISHGQHLIAETRDPTRGTPETQATSPVPYLWGLGSDWKMYDAVTGALRRTITNVDRALPASTGQGGNFRMDWFDGNPVVYIVRQSGWNTTIPYRLAESELIKWDYNKVTGNDWETGVVWRTNLKQPDGTGPGEGNRGSGLLTSGDVGVVRTTGEETLYGYDLNTGAQLYVKNVGYPMMAAIYADAKGRHWDWDSAERRFHAYDIKTGNEVWVSDVIGEYPWGSQVLPRAVAYDQIYLGTYDGHAYALDLMTGKTNWKSDYVGDTTETVFGNWAFYGRTFVADGKLYWATSEHTPTQPRIRGNKLYCIDAHTGKFIWRISGFACSDWALAEGYLLGINENDGYYYCFGKGKTAVEVLASPKITTKGSSILIEGMVTDQSPAQAGTPAVSDESMSGWMEYMHMQKPMPMDVTGVPVKLIVVHPDGNVEWIYTRTTDMYGNFAHKYVPPTEGVYKIIAQFDGSESYWPSSAETAIGVDPGSSPAQEFGWQELAEAPITM